MALILQVVAAVLTVLGAGTLYWGTTPSLLSLGNTVMVVGAVIAAAGIILFGLAAVLGQLGVLAGKLDDLRWALGNPAAQPAAPQATAEAAAAPPPAEAVAEPSPFWREGLPEQPAAPAAGAPIAPPAPPPAPAVLTPPSRESFGLPPLATGAAIGAAASFAAGMAAAAPAASPSAREAEADKPAVAPSLAAEEPTLIEAPEVPVIEPALIEPVLVEPVVVEPAAAEKDATGDEAAKADAKATEPDAEALVDDLEQHLAQAVENLKEEVKAAEADIAPPVAAGAGDQAADETPAGEKVSADPMASLEKLLLGDPPAPARAPADEREPGGFMARLRDTFARPPQPEPAPAASEESRDEPLAADESDRTGEPKEPPAVAAPAAPEPAREPEPAPEPRFSIEDELEKALKASLEEKPIGAPDLGAIRPEPPVYASPEPRQAPEPPVRQAPEVTIERTGGGAGREDAMAALVRDFPELNDLLAPKKPAATPADSLIEDLKGIFEPPAGSPPARQEPALAPPPPPLPAPPAASSAPLLREGVIAGIPFRLYGDGTIEADLETGTTQFASLKDFRAHVGG